MNSFTISESCVVMPEFGIKDSGMHQSREQQYNSNIDECLPGPHPVLGTERAKIVAGLYKSLLVNSLLLIPRLAQDCPTQMMRSRGGICLEHNGIMVTPPISCLFQYFSPCT